MASSLPVAIASNQSAVPVSGTFWQATAASKFGNSADNSRHGNLLADDPAGQHRDHAHDPGNGDFLADHAASFRDGYSKSGRNLERRTVWDLDGHSDSGHRSNFHVVCDSGCSVCRLG